MQSADPEILQQNRNMLLKISMQSIIREGKFVSPKLIQIQSSNSNLYQNMSHKLKNLYDLSWCKEENSTKLTRINKFPLIDDQTNIEVISPNKQFIAKFSKLPSRGDKNKKVQVLEIFSQDTLFNSLCLDDLHQDIIANSINGPIVWNQESTQILYVASVKAKKTKCIFDFQNESPEQSDKLTKDFIANNQYREDFGECYDDIFETGLFLYDILQHSLQQILLPKEDNLFVTYPQFLSSSGSIIFQGTPNYHGHNLAMLYCENRRAFIFQIDLKTHPKKEIYPKKQKDKSKQPGKKTKIQIKLSDLRVISDPQDEACLRPLLSPDLSKLLYFSNDVLKAHHNSHKIKMINLAQQNQISEIVPIYDILDISAQLGGFQGTHDEMCNTFWLNDNVHVVFASPYKASQYIYLLNTENKQMASLSKQFQGLNSKKEYNILFDILDVSKETNQILAVSTTPFFLQRLHLISNLNLNLNSLQDIASLVRCEFMNVRQTNMNELELFYEELALDSFEEVEIIGKERESIGYLWKINNYSRCHDRYKQYRCIVDGNDTNSDTPNQSTSQDKIENMNQQEINDLSQDINKPMIVEIHGGPHSNIYNLTRYRMCLLLEGFNVLLPCYSGSTGYGQKFNDRTIGDAGNSDVIIQPCIQKVFDVVDQIRTVVSLKLCNESQVIADGGSHGGFISAHLACRFPQLIKGAIAMCPVLNLLYQTLSDIPEWSNAEFLNKNFCYDLSREDYEKLFHQSPHYHIKNLQVPLLLLFGKLDRRTPAVQCHQFLNKAKQFKKNVTAYEYSNAGHSIADCPDTFYEVLMRVFIFFRNALENKH